ncbi:hypothetical protein Pm5460_04 [Proteus phage vB_PmiP_Pm5460]|uniref:Uncharacterized protein n=1 Tax=Proteus phage vB_PmiP_Pm5460 TaxID=1636249 RepID=A0A0G2SRZ8_9CAUD|nr:hypothetical protein AVT60_gp04 [Proteus phage vB_PmiP_Pm5460]AKA61813.1 hypothetical protein Pm5460_04 [Proteus phage vB_PmiP_Pm5460]
MLNRIDVHFKLLSAEKDVYFKRTWTNKPSDYPFIMGINIEGTMYYPDGNTMDNALYQIECAYDKWHYIQDVLKDTFKRDKECLYLTFQPIIKLHYYDGSVKELDTKDNWFSFDWHEGYDWSLEERLNQLFFETEQAGEALGDNVEDLEEWLESNPLTWTWDNVSMS